ncbi:hypothetical protein [Streptomyces sp. NPDC058751]|uniref:hypothetical protein n=1 Tax=Streptomyces sp. NPDC058751 TaxID=3346623 RepID=UPI00369420E5
MAADGYELHGWMLFLAAVPAMALVTAGVASSSWPPAPVLVGGGAAGGLYALAQGRTEPHVTSAAVFSALAVVAPTATWWRRRTRDGGQE